MSRGALSALRAAALVVVVLLSLLAAAFGDRAPWLAPANAAFAWLVGKLLGVPLDGVVDAALQTMQQETRLRITVRAMRSLPPAAARQVIESMPPDEQAQIVEFVESIRPPPMPPLASD